MITTTSSSISNNESQRFPSAAQLKIMRATEKDDLYASSVYDACRDAFHHDFGTRRAVAYPSEVIKLIN